MQMPIILLFSTIDTIILEAGHEKSSANGMVYDNMIVNVCLVEYWRWFGNYMYPISVECNTSTRNRPVSEWINQLHVNS